MALGFLSACGVSQSQYDSVVAENQRLRQQLADSQAQTARLQGAVKYTIDSDLLFPSGSWQVSEQGKQIISRMASQLAPTQQNKLAVNGYTDNVAIGAELQRQGITSNQALSQKRADAVMQYITSQGLNPALISAHGFGEANPIAANDTPQGRAKNRRVELTLAGAN